MLKQIEGYKSMLAAAGGVVIYFAGQAGMLTQDQTAAGIVLATGLFGAAFAQKVNRVNSSLGAKVRSKK